MNCDYEGELEALTDDFLTLIEKYKAMQIPVDLLISNQIMNLFFVANMKSLRFSELCEMVLRGSASYRNAKTAIEGEKL